VTEKAPDAEKAPIGRRTAIRWLVRGFLSLWALGAAVLAGSFLRTPETRRGTAEGVVRCGTLSSLPVGEARFIRHGTDPFFVIRATETQALALSATCTHRRCVLNWESASRTIHCPCHAGIFDRNGNVLSGPPTKPLAQFPAEVRFDQIIVRVSS
jgi:cytochrome b6-f complex iron-sulfur subunit